MWILISRHWIGTQDLWASYLHDLLHDGAFAPDRSRRKYLLCHHHRTGLSIDSV